MASTPSTRNRLEKQETGANSNIWGTKLNAAVIDLLDVALDGWSQITLTGDRTLTSANFVADESRARMLRLFGSGSYTLTIPSVEKWYFVDNQLTGTLSVTAGSGTTATIAAGCCAAITCDAVDVKTFLGAPGSLTTVGSAGYLGLPPNHQTGNYNVVLSDNGGMVVMDAPGGYFGLLKLATLATPEGFTVILCNVSGSPQQIVMEDASTPVYWINSAGAPQTGTRSLQHIGMARATRVGSAWIVNDLGTGVS